MPLFSLTKSVIKCINHLIIFLISSAKPPLPPRPAKLSRVSPGKRSSCQPKPLSHQNVEHQDKGCLTPSVQQERFKTCNSDHDVIVNQNVSEQGNLSVREEQITPDIDCGHVKSEAGTVGAKTASIPEPSEKSAEIACTGKNWNEIIKNEVVSPEDKAEQKLQVPPKPSRSNKLQESHFMAVAVGKESSSTNKETMDVPRKPNIPERPKPPVKSPSITTENKPNVSNKGKKPSTILGSPTNSNVSETCNLSHGKGKSTPNKPLHVVEKQIPPVEGGTKTSKQSVCITVSEVNNDSGKVKETYLGEESTTSDALKNDSSKHLESDVVQEIISAYDNSNVVSEKPEASEKCCNVHIPSEKLQYREIETEPPSETQNEVFSPETPKTKDKNFDNEGHSKKEAKPPRSRAPSRKSDVHESSNPDILEYTAIRPSCHLEEQLSEDTKTKHIVSPKSLRPCTASSKTEDIQILEDVALHKKFNVVQGIEHEGNKCEKLTSPKPSRPHPPSKKTKQEQSLESCEKFLPKNILVEKSEIAAKDMHTENRNVEIMASPKPSRPRPPLMKTLGESSERFTLSAENIPHEASRDLDKTGVDVNKCVDHEDKQTKKSPKALRPLASSRKVEGEMSLDCNGSSSLIEKMSIKPFSALDGQSPAVDPDAHTSQKIVSPKPSKPKPPARPAVPQKITKDLTNNASNDERGKRMNVEKPDKPLESKTTKIKPQRPSMSHHPNESAQTKDCGSDYKSDIQSKGCQKHTTFVVMEHVPHRDKPRSPSKPCLPKDVPASERPVLDPKVEQQKEERNKNFVDEPQQPVTFAKPQRPSKPKLLMKQTVNGTEENSTNSATPETPCTNNAVTQANKHDNDDITSEDNDYSIRTVSDKLSRQPKDCKTSHDIPSEETLSSEGSKPKPPRPEGTNHDQQPHDGINVSVEIPKKPKRSSTSANYGEDVRQLAAQKEENVQELDNSVKLGEKNQESVDQIVASGPEVLFNKPSESNRNDNESEASKTGSNKACDAARVKCEETSQGCGEDHSKSSKNPNRFKRTRPPLPSRTSSLPKDGSEKEPIITVKRRAEEKQDKINKETSKNGKSNDRHGLRLRVSSLSKTEVESSTTRDFLDKVKDQGHSKHNSEEDLSGSSHALPKPARSRPPSANKTPGEQEGQVEELNAKASTEIMDRSIKVKRKAPSAPAAKHVEVKVNQEYLGVEQREEDENMIKGPENIDILQPNIPRIDDQVVQVDLDSGSRSQTLSNEKISDLSHESEDRATNVAGEHQVFDQDNERSTETSTVEQTFTVENKPGVNNVMFGSENQSPTVETPGVGKTTQGFGNESSEQDAKESDIGTMDDTSTFQSLKKKTPPPKPKRTSSSKEDPKPAAPKVVVLIFYIFYLL